MPREEIDTYIISGSRIKVYGERSETEGWFRGVGLTEDGHASIVLKVQDAALPFAYRLVEVRRIEHLDPSHSGGDVLERAESPPEGSYRLVDRERVQVALERQARETGGVIPAFVQEALDEVFGEVRE